MNSQIIKYYAGELSKEERKALLQKAFSNQELKNEMMNYQHLQSLMNLHPQEKNELLGKESLKCFMKARQAEKRKRLFFLFFTLCSNCLCVRSFHLVDYFLVRRYGYASVCYCPGIIGSGRTACAYPAAGWK
ncbi:hypothetical protein ACIXEG_18980 [Bacteroides fragilis]